MASSFDVLPPEIAQKCVEFLDFDLVTGELKGVSKATRGVARRALTRGRWKPFRYVAEQGLAAVSEIDHRAFFLEPPAAEAEMYFHGARAWSDDWVDRTKASAFVVEMARIYDASPWTFNE